MLMNRLTLVTREIGGLQETGWNKRKKLCGIHFRVYSLSCDASTLTWTLICSGEEAWPAGGDKSQAGEMGGCCRRPAGGVFGGPDGAAAWAGPTSPVPYLRYPTRGTLPPAPWLSLAGRGGPGTKEESWVITSHSYSGGVTGLMWGKLGLYHITTCYSLYVDSINLTINSMNPTKGLGVCSVSRLLTRLHLL